MDMEAGKTLTNMQNQIKEMQEDTLVNNAKKA